MYVILGILLLVFSGLVFWLGCISSTFLILWLEKWRLRLWPKLPAILTKRLF